MNNQDKSKMEFEGFSKFVICSSLVYVFLTPLIIVFFSGIFYCLSPVKLEEITSIKQLVFPFLLFLKYVFFWIILTTILEFLSNCLKLYKKEIRLYDFFFMIMEGSYYIGIACLYCAILSAYYNPDIDISKTNPFIVHR